MALWKEQALVGKAQNYLRKSDGFVVPNDPMNGDYALLPLLPNGKVDADPADPVPIQYGNDISAMPRVQTSGVTPAELYRATLAAMTAYTALVELTGVDGGNGNIRYIRATVVVKRLGAGAIIVPVTSGALFTLLSDHRDGVSSTWLITPSVSGNDFVLTVTGAAGRTIDWFCRLSIDSFVPAGV